MARALSAPNPTVRGLALEVICEFSKRQAVGLVAAAIHDSEPAIRCTAAALAGRLGGLRAVPALIAALQDRESDVRAAAARALEQITGQQLDPTQPTPRQVLQLKEWWTSARLAELMAKSN